MINYPEYPEELILPSMNTKSMHQIISKQVVELSEDDLQCIENNLIKEDPGKEPLEAKTETLKRLVEWYSILTLYNEEYFNEPK